MTGSVLIRILRLAISVGAVVQGLAASLNCAKGSLCSIRAASGGSEITRQGMYLKAKFTHPQGRSLEYIIVGRPAVDINVLLAAFRLFENESRDSLRLIVARLLRIGCATNATLKIMEIELFRNWFWRVNNGYLFR